MATTTGQDRETPTVPTDAPVDFAVLGEIFEAAKERLDPTAWDFFEGGAGEEITVAANRSSFTRWEFRPRVLSGISPPDVRTTFMGIDLSMPVMTAPFGADRLFHPDGQLAVARANARMGTASMVPGGGSFTLEEVRAAAPSATPIFQLHPVGTDTAFRELIRRAEDAGFDALCITADCPTRGWRERILRRRFRPEAENGLMSGNYRESDDELLGQLSSFDQDIWSWTKLSRLLAGARIPYMIKGVLTAEDARRAVEIGAAAIGVSNHGGRQLDGAPAALDQLPEVVDAVSGAAEIALDGGVRRGTDILKAIALGADVTIIGRTAVAALAAAGEAGVVRALELLHAELVNVMALVGRGTMNDVDRSLLQRARNGMV